MSSRLIICMGVSGVGKTTYALKIANTLNLDFADADAFHSLANKQKMQQGIPLVDADREPWMQAISEYLNHCAKRKADCVLAHSALRRKHRDQLRSCGLNALFLHFSAPRETITKRLMARENHFMPVSLLDSQFAALESTETEKDILTIDTAKNRQAVTEAALSAASAFISRN